MFSRNLLFNNIVKVTRISEKCIKTSPRLQEFWEKYEKGGYKDSRKPPSVKERMREGLKELRHEIQLWSEEMKEHIASDPYLLHRPGETDVQWNFKNEASLKNWVVTADSDHSEGFSKCSLELTNTGKGLFSGELSTQVPQDGKLKRAGYCNIKTMRARKSFKRETFINWENHNMLVLRVRGDGRSYMLNIGCKGYYDMLWNDVYQYVLYTRGGPYWQITKIPFSKFFLSSKGRIQDKQYPIPLNRVTSFGVSAGDKINGSFALELDYIGVEYDPNLKEEFAYEMYETPKYISAS